MTKSVKIQVTEDGQKYFTIFEIKAVKHDGEVIIYDRELTKKAAEERAKFVEDTLSNLYKYAFIREQFVWC